MANILKGNPSREERKLWLAFNSLIFFGKFILSAGRKGAGDFNKTETPEFHRIIDKEYMARSNKPCAFILPRESAKTSFSKAKILHSLCFAKKAYEWGWAKQPHTFFFGWCADAQKKSIKNTSFVKLHLLYNPLIKRYFGDGFDLRGKEWNQENITTKNGDKLISTSNMTNMRGDTNPDLFEGSLRYSGIFIDDSESEQNTITENSRDRIADTILNGIMPAIQKVNMDTWDSWFTPRMFFSGTPLHLDAFAQKLIDQWRQKVKEHGGGDPLYWTNDPEEIMLREQAEKDFRWRVISFKSTQPDLPGGVLWESHKPRKILDEELENYKINEHKGIAGYYQEYELEVMAEEDAAIGRSVIQYYKGMYQWDEELKMGFLNIDGHRKAVNTFIGCDPATDIDKKDSDFAVIMCVAIDADNNCYVLDYERHRAIPTIAARSTVDNTIIGKKGVIDYMVEMYDHYHCSGGKVEDVAMTRSIFPSLNDFRRKNNRFDIAISGHEPGTQQSKLDRIYTGLWPRFAAGAMFYRETQHELINETVKFGPKLAHDDCMDALNYACIGTYPPKVRIENNEEIYNERMPVLSWYGNTPVEEESWMN